MGCALLTDIIGFIVSFEVAAAPGSAIAAMMAAAVVVGIAAAIPLMLMFSATPGKAAIGGTILTVNKLAVLLLLFFAFAV